MNMPVSFYYCCDPSFDQEERTTILAKSPRYAAEGYATYVQERYADKGETTIPVWVYDRDGGETRWMVHRVMTPVFWARPE